MWTSHPDSAIQWARDCIESSQRQGEQRRQAEALTVWGEVAWEQKAYAESRRLLEQALALFRQIDDQIGVADVYHWLGHLVLEQGDHAQAQVFFQDSYTRLKDFGDRVSLTLLLNDLGLVAYFQEDYATSRAYSEQDLALCREIENKFGMAMTYNRLGDLARCEEDYGRADALYQESLALFKAVGDNPQTTAVSHNIAHVRLSQSKVADAARLFNQALHEFQAMGDQNGVIDCLAGLAGVAIISGQPAIGVRWLSASEKAKQDLGTTWWPANHLAYRRHLARAREQMDGEAFNAAWDAGRALSLAQAIDLAIANTELPIVRPH
jgi:tetratricopeptide (TPR) repeat protein